MIFLLESRYEAGRKRLSNVVLHEDDSRMTILLKSLIYILAEGVNPI